ncbi:type II toxin-antitoxin system VapC family toxin [Komagataeibacter sp. FNDCR1]|nr:type II toxin-antitoxin system VapC family toxin [Komagataeibacter sp. FNDCR1]
MILLDINVISEPWKPVPEPRVLAWIDEQAVETLFLSAVTVAELRFGIGALPDGRRRSVLRERLEQQVLPLFEGRVLSFDLAASQTYADLMVRARSEGRAIGKADGYIAATVASRGYAVASRDVSVFEAAGVRVLNPWEDV